MRSTRVTLGLLLLLLATVPACVELTGQRITWSYDAAKDELVALIHYDGIHDSGNDSNGKGVQQVPAFVAGGDVMFLDWIGHLDMPQLRNRAEDPALKPVDRDWAKLLITLRVEAVGYYREPDGRMGALQKITIPKAGQFVQRANELINRSILDEPTAAPQTPMKRRIRNAAEARHAWIKLEGNSVRVDLPIDQDEWAGLKAEALKQAGQWAAKTLDEKADPKEKRNFPAAVRALTAAPLSYLEEDDRAQFVLGRKKAPSTLRLSIREEYEPSLEKAVAEAVRVDLDKALADALLGPQAAPPETIRDLLAWGPPEDRVRALLGAAGSDPAERKEAAVKKLSAFADQWNRDARWPVAPHPTTAEEKSLAAWKTWYARMRHYPLKED